MPKSFAVAEHDLRGELAQADPKELEHSDDLHASLASAVHDYCEAARASGQPPESVIRQLKEIIAEQYQSAVVRPGVLAKDVVWHAVRRCIHAYFAESGVRGTSAE